MDKREAAVVGRFTRLVKSRRPGWRIRKINGLGMRDWPDLLIAAPGVLCLIEFKRPGEKPRLTQEILIQDLLALGVNVAVFDDDSAAFAWVDSLSNRMRNA